MIVRCPTREYSHVGPFGEFGKVQAQNLLMYSADLRWIFKPYVYRLGPVLLEAKPRIISDSGPSSSPRDFKESIRISGITHLRTSPFYPQSNGKIESWHDRLKESAFGPERRCRWKMQGVWAED